MNTRTRLSAWLAASALALGACGGDDPEVPSGSESAPDAGAKSGAARIGEAARSVGIVLTVNDAYAARSVAYVGGVEAADTPDAKPRTVRAPRNGRYVFVETIVVNETEIPIDLTCSAPIDAKVVGDAGRRFEPISGIAQIEGNPRCYEPLQPGATADMTWVFAVPARATISSFEFADVSKLLTASPSQSVSTPEPTVVALPELGARRRP